MQESERPAPAAPRVGARQEPARLGAAAAGPWPDRVADLVARAATLPEVFARPPGDAKVAPAVVQDVLREWAAVAAHGDREKLAWRLAWSDWSEEKLARGLAAAPTAAESAPWVSTLREIMREAAAPGGPTPAFAPGAAEALPFEDIWLPALRVAERRLVACHPTAWSRFSAAARAALVRSLLRRLAFLGSRALAHEFDHFRPESTTLLARWLGAQANGAPTHYYQQFVARCRDDGHAQLFAAYPVLARLAAGLVDQWVAAAGDFVRHLEADAPALAATFQAGRPLGQVESLDAGLSDPHLGGRVVHGLVFASGLRLIYKPKSLGLEAAFQDLLAWSNRAPGMEPFRLLTVVDRADHGWVEFVPQAPLADPGGVRRFYERAGQLVCLVDLLRGKDCHLENVRASGEHLFLIDGEALAHPEPGPALLGPVIEDTAWHQLTGSVARTGLLPSWEFSSDRRVARDISGLGSVTEQSSLGAVPRWRAVNTDHMHLVHEPKTERLGGNAPVLDGQPVDPQAHVAAITAGYERMYQHVQARCDELRAADGPLAGFARQPVRYIYRATQVYQELIYQSLAPACLASGVVRSMHLDVVFRPHLAAERPPLGPIVDAEIAALAELDIPAFYASTDSADLPLGGGRVLAGCFRAASHADILHRLRSFSDSDRATQVAILTGSFFARSFRLAHVPLARPATPARAPEPLQPDELVSEATAIAASIESQAIRESDGGLSWLNLSFEPLAERYQLQPAPLQLYDGGLGVAQFMALLARTTGQARWQDLARGALRPILRQFEVPVAELAPWAQLAGIGAAVGVTSLIHGLVRVAQSLDDPAALDAARHLARLVTPELIAADRKFDVLSGSAGAILGLLTLWAATRDPAVLAQAVGCGEHLLRHRVPGPADTQTWRTLGPQPLTGFSHGAAGIAYALLRLAQASGDGRYRAAADSAIAFERALFVAAARNWPDLRPAVIEKGFTLQAMGWCNGAPGIGLARLGAWDLARDDALRAEVDVALSVTQDASLDALDHLCCGSFGRMDLLIEASLRFQQPQLLAVARGHAAYVMDRAHRQGGCTVLPGWSTPVFCCGLFQGYSGIGYQLLRLAAPTEVPSVLLWQ
jgi:type 2 lantibiotic biosynthesis protein LanM